MKCGNLVTTIEVTDEEGNISTREIVTYAGLLSKAHERGLQRIETKIEQMPTKENCMTAICTATVTTTQGVFSDCGDASPDNVRSGAIPHIIRVALTRAKVRALRDAVNVGTISIEELSEYPPESGRPADQRNDSSESSSDASKKAKPMSDAQRSRLLSLVEKLGKTGEDAEKYLCRQLGVKTLAEANISTASTLIKKLLEEISTKSTLVN